MQFFKGLIILFVFTSTVLTATAQGIKGKITDFQTGETLPGVTIMVDNLSKGTNTDGEGNYEVSLSPGTYSLTVSYISYKTIHQSNVKVEAGKTTELNLRLESADMNLKEVEVIGRVNRESENILLLEQKQALLATQAVGAREMSRKGASTAEAAVAKISGVSKQEGVKNVFVRGLSDRYNATTLNGFPIPSEDPEYKNISLDFFGSDVIQNVNVSKVFNGNNAGDVAGAVIDISSKELVGEYALSAELSGGLNNEAVTNDFKRQDGVNYWGFANSGQPTAGKYDFQNKLDPTVVKMPFNQGFGLSGGKKFRLGKNGNPLSVFVVASHSTDYSYTQEDVKTVAAAGAVFRDQSGYKYSQNTNQLILANVNFSIGQKHSMAYNFMMVHTNNQYVGEYTGLNTETYQDSENYLMGYLRRQQANDNLLFTNQLITNWTLAEKLKLNIGASVNSISGNEPDRRENNLSMAVDRTYVLTGSNRQKRFFSELNESDYNVKAGLTYALNDALNSGKSSISVGYIGRFVEDKFDAREYNYTAFSGKYDLNTLKLDDLYNQTNFEQGEFTMKTNVNTYHVAKLIHSAYVDAVYQFTKELTANVGFRFDNVDLAVDYNVQNTNPGKKTLQPTYYLPSLNLKYDLNEKNSLRLGASKTYTLPQSKEISPYQYVNINFASQGNPNLLPSDNYNVDLKWDYYLSASELLSVTAYYKHILNPIGRVDEGNSAGLLTYNNISKSANVAGLEVEIRKNIFNKTNEDAGNTNKLSVGVNGSLIYTNLELDVRNTEKRNTRLEGASPFILNSDVSYNYIQNEKNLTLSLVFNYFSDRIHTLGTRYFKDIIEIGVPTLDFVSSYKFNKSFGLKLKASNLLNSDYKLERDIYYTGETFLLSRFKKGINLSLGVTFDL